MKLIDEKIKALGLTKGRYCEKYGFKFKDFAAKVHTLEAKIEWANSFLKPLGLTVEILCPPVRYASAAAFASGEALTSRKTIRSGIFPVGTLIEWDRPDEAGTARAEIAMVDMIEECYGVHVEYAGGQDLIPFKEARLVNDADSLL